jgi:large-conductance mechanosensitive channel
VASIEDVVAITVGIIVGTVVGIIVDTVVSIIVGIIGVHTLRCSDWIVSSGSIALYHVEVGAIKPTCDIVVSD